MDSESHGLRIVRTPNRTDSESHGLRIARTPNYIDSQLHGLRITQTLNRTNSESHIPILSGWLRRGPLSITVSAPAAAVSAAPASTTVFGLTPDGADSGRAAELEEVSAEEIEGFFLTGEVDTFGLSLLQDELK